MRAIGIVRQSKGSEDALSPTEQRGRIAQFCEREGWKLVAVREEIDVSGGTPLARRDGLRGAVEAVERREADVVLVAYFDRLVRSLVVQAEVVSRVEAAGGKVMAVDAGQITEATAAQWISATTLGMVSEYHRRTTGERTAAAQAEAIARGVPTWDHVTPGYVKGEDKRLYPDPELAPVVAEAFRMRADRGTLAEVRRYLRKNGIERSYNGVQTLLASRVVLGELHFGELSNLAAHEPIVERHVWDRVQAMRGTRAAHSRSDRLLARLGILRCANCGHAMVVGVQTQNGRRYPFYRCSSVNDCDQRVTIGARIVEEWVTEQVKVALAGVEGRASAEGEAKEAEAALERTQAALDSAIRAFASLGDEPAALERLDELRRERDAARDRVEHLGHLHSVRTFGVAENWDRAPVSEQRAFIRATVEAVRVERGRGTERLSISFRPFLGK